MRKAMFVLSGLMSMTCPRLAPAQTMTVSAVSPSGDFSVSLSFPPLAERPATNQATPFCFTLPEGNYSRAWTFTAASDDQTTARSVLNIEKDGVTVAPRFEFIRPTQTGDAWKATDISMSGGPGLCVRATVNPSTAPVVWLVKLVGKIY